jgi:hypothetical protein
MIPATFDDYRLRAQDDDGYQVSCR